MKLIAALLFSCSALFTACNTSSSSSTAPATAPVAELPQGTAFGEKLEPRSSVRFAVVDAEPPKYFNQTLLVEATVKAVCQKKGCWMQVEDQGRTAMVRWESGCGGKFKFPTDAAGKRVLIQGSFYPKTISEADAKHIEEEAGKSIAIPREGYEFNASAVLVLDKQG